jgi:hypothetical protein
MVIGVAADAGGVLETPGRDVACGVEVELEGVVFD